MGKSNKTRYTATYREARYVGTHPHIRNKLGVYYWSEEQSSYVFRPDSIDSTKTDWYRVHFDNLRELN